MASWFVYIVRCADDTLYTGITTDVNRRVSEHNGKKAARYTRSRQPVKICYIEATRTRSDALKREAAIKKLSRAKKDPYTDKEEIKL
jgi:putative endonuclease